VEHRTTARRADLVSVIIPAFNAAQTIAQQLDALVDQECVSTFEVIVADNGSTDDTVKVAETFADRLNIRVVDASAIRGAGPARNVGVTASRGELLVFADADDIAGTDWLHHLVTTATAAGCDFAAGPLDLEKLNSAEVLAWRHRSPMDRLPDFLHFLPYAQGGNFAIWRDVFQSLGGFGADLSDDVGLSWRAQLAGYVIVFSPLAVMHCRRRGSLRGFGRQQLERGEANCVIYKQFRENGLRRPSQLKAIRQIAKCLVQIPFVIVQPRRRGVWVGEIMYRIGRIRGSIRYRVLFL